MPKKDTVITRRERIYNYGKSTGINSLSFGKKMGIAALILGMTFAVYIICFAGRTPIGTHIKPTIRIVSPFDFEYISDIATKEARDRAAKRVPPVYEIVKVSDETLSTNLLKFVGLLNERRGKISEQQTPDADDETKSASAMSEEEFLDHLKRTTGFTVTTNELRNILSLTKIENTENTFKRVLVPLTEIINDGIYRDDDEIFAESDEFSYEVFGQSHHRRSLASARRAFKSHLNGLDISKALSDAFYSIFSQKLAPNMIYNEAESKKKADLFASKVKPVKITIKEGDIISDPTHPDRFSQERWTAFRKEIAKNQNERSIFKDFVNEITISFLLVFSAALFIKISKSSQTRKPKTIIIFSTLLILNLIVERVLVQMTDANSSQGWFYILVYGMPIMLGPVIQVLLCSPYTGFVMSLILAILTAMMLGQNLGFLVVTFAAVLVAIYFVNGAQTRKQVLMGGTLYGLCLAIFSPILVIAHGYEPEHAVRLSGLAIALGFIIGVAATVLLPLFERIFKISSNITLLEYTDYNNPLLRMLQMEAPGTYHHSLMVSQIAELAAVRIGANHLVCSVGGLYHDVGKVIKPEFFSENQASENPHDAQLPTMSALIIKSHIREGLDIAKKYKMPPPILEAIAEHHGNGIISYFYNKAVKIAGGNASKADLVQALRNVGIEEGTFRHEGTKPQSTETAILMLADSCEAASRSLKRITPHSIEELVDAIFQAKMNDNQLDESPITLRQIAKVRESFIFTLQNMLHSRVEYNNAPNQPKSAPKKENSKSNEFESQKPQD